MLVKEIKYAQKISEFKFTLIIFKLLCLLALDKKVDIAFDKKIDIRPNKLPIIDLIFCTALTQITRKSMRITMQLVAVDITTPRMRNIDQSA